MQIQVEDNHYVSSNYVTLERWSSYWYQINTIRELFPLSILEIGIGNGSCKDYLIKNNYKVITLDIDIKLHPNVLGSIEKIPFKSKSFNIVACFEVLEHITYDSCIEALREIYRVTDKYCVLSIPDCRRAIRFQVQLPCIGQLKKMITLPFLIKPVHNYDGEHYWELGKSGYSIKNFIQDIEKCGFETTNHFRPYEFPYHHFFILRKYDL